MQPHVLILLATYNGGKFLSEQLESFCAQTHLNWSLLVSDDGSQDGTKSIIREFSLKNPERSVSIIEGPSKGFACNFHNLLKHALLHSSEYFAFSDQDDIWLPEKIQRSIESLSNVPKSIPALYCGSSILIDRQGRRIGRSKVFSRPPSFGNSLLQNIASGNTMLFNTSALQLATAFPSATIPFHDWWLYFIVSGAGGRVIYDANPSILYRQHGSNAIGHNSSLASKARRVSALLGGRYPLWTAGDSVFDLISFGGLTPENKKLFFEFREVVKSHGVGAFSIFRDNKVYRQEKFANLSFLVALLMGSIDSRK